jgi:hypothetical protein
MSCVEIYCFFDFGKQIKEKRANTCLTNRARHELIAGTVSATAGTVGEQHHAVRAGRNTQIAVKHRCARANLNVAGPSGSCVCGVNHLTRLFSCLLQR